MAINSVDLVGDIRPVVTPQSTELLADAFRKGFVTADDIMERVSERTRAKQELELITAQQGIANAQDPQLIQAARSQQLLAGDQAQQTRDLLPLARRATEEKLNADIRSGQIARYGLKEKLEALNNVGFAPAPDPSKGITPEYALEVNKKFGTMLRWQKKKADGVFNSALFDAGEIVTPAGTFSGPMDKITGAPGDPKQISQWRKDAAMTLPEFLLAEPPGGVVDAVSQPIAQPVAQAVAPVIQTAQSASLAPIIQPVAQAAAPIIQPAQAGIPPGFIQVKPAPPPKEERPAEGQQRALLAVPRFEEANKILGALNAKGYDAASKTSWLAGYAPQLFKGENRKDLETAMSAWSQGLLRLESGAAITAKEQDWYDRTFFPTVNDTPATQAKKTALRESVEAMAKEIGTAGPIPPAIIERVRNLRNSLPGGATPTAGAPAVFYAPTAPLPATPSAAPVVSTIAQFNALPSGTVFREPDGTLRKKP